LPGAEELFRKTSAPSDQREAEGHTTVDESPPSPRLEVAETPEPEASSRRGPKHDEKVTFYCTKDDLMSLERARLMLRADHGVAADRGRIVRAALAYVLEDFQRAGDSSVLLRKLSE
jgi:hypothetical protein